MKYVGMGWTPQRARRRHSAALFANSGPHTLSQFAKAVYPFVLMNSSTSFPSNRRSNGRYFSLFSYIFLIFCSLSLLFLCHCLPVYKLVSRFPQLEPCRPNHIEHVCYPCCLSVVFCFAVSLCVLRCHCLPPCSDCPAMEKLMPPDFRLLSHCRLYC